jgi:hypothetical protein
VQGVCPGYPPLSLHPRVHLHLNQSCVGSENCRDCSRTRTILRSPPKETHFLRSFFILRPQAFAAAEPATSALPFFDVLCFARPFVRLVFDLLRLRRVVRVVRVAPAINERTAAGIWFHPC